MERGWWGQLDRPLGGPQEAAVSIFAVTMGMHAVCAAAGLADPPGMVGFAALAVVVEEWSSLRRWDYAETSHLRCWRRYLDSTLESVVAGAS